MMPLQSLRSRLSRYRSVGFSFCALAFLVLAGCKETPTMFLSYEEQLAIDLGIIEKYLEENQITAEKTSSGLYYRKLESGTGPVGATGKTVRVDYLGKSLTNYTFESTYATGVPFTFTVGGAATDVRSSHKWWHEALPLMKEGDEYRFFVPSGMAYGRQGTQSIPANAILVYDLTLKKVL